MAYFEDLSSYEYFTPVSGQAVARNVGWLDLHHEFPTQTPDPRILTRLWEHCSVLVMPTRGYHECELCAQDTTVAERDGMMLRMGTAEIRVFGNGEFFAAPNLVYHYVSQHSYRPPARFIEALLNGPAPPSEEYFDRLRALGVDWRDNPPLTEKPETFRLTEHGRVRVGK